MARLDARVQIITDCLLFRRFCSCVFSRFETICLYPTDCPLLRVEIATVFSPRVTSFFPCSYPLLPFDDKLNSNKAHEGKKFAFVVVVLLRLHQRQCSWRMIFANDVIVFLYMYTILFTIVDLNRRNKCIGTFQLHLELISK